MGMMASQITSLTSVNSTAYSGADQRKHQSSASLAFVQGIHWWPLNSPHEWPVTRKMFPFDDVIMWIPHQLHTYSNSSASKVFSISIIMWPRYQPVRAVVTYLTYALLLPHCSRVKWVHIKGKINKYDCCRILQMHFILQAIYHLKGILQT